MDSERLIAIGCDNTASLSIVLNSIKEIDFCPKNIISATRVSDLISIVNSVNPDLIILCFRNNQIVLRDFASFVKKTEIPILCLTSKFESNTLVWNRNSIVFTCPLEHVSEEGYLTLRINSIFLLEGESSKNIPRNTLANAAIQPEEANNARDLSRYVLELDQKIEVLLRIKDRIADLYPRVNDPTRTELISIVNSIKNAINSNKVWDDFKLYFEGTDPNFLLLLAQKHPALTPIDLKYCCYLKMNMTNDDIRSLFGINQESVRTHTYRIKKKMALSREQDLRSYLRSVG
jgi:DNA-binding CsgD family transcriptional regulator